MKILAFAASNSQTSINRKLVEYAISTLKDDIFPNAEIKTLDVDDYEMPIYRPDREEEGGIPEAAQQFYQKIGEADAILVSFAEHNGFVTAAWKNLFDWMSRIDMKIWQDKPTVMLAATPGGRAGQGVLQSQAMIMPFFGGDLKGSVGIGNWYDVWNDETKQLMRDEDIAEIKQTLKLLKGETND